MEQYIVKFKYKKQDGLWGIGEEKVMLCKKGKHEKAEELIKRKYPDCKIVSVIFV